MKTLTLALIVLSAAAASAQSVPSVDPAVDPHRFFLGGEALFLTGYYPGIQPLIVHPQITNFNNPVSSTYYRSLIDTLVANDVNLLRVVLTMGMALENREWLHPYERSGTCCTNHGVTAGNRFDVSRFNQKFFDYWDAVLGYANSQGMIVQVAIFDGFHSRVWDRSDPSIAIPLERYGRRFDYFRFGNNVNGHLLSDTAALYGGEAGIKDRQIAFVQKVVSELGGHPNLIWEVSNEPVVNQANVPGEAWLNDMRAEIRRAESAAKHPAHLIMPFDSPDHRDLSGHFTPDGSSTVVDPAEYTAVHTGLVSEFHQFGKPLIADNDCCPRPGTPEQLRKKAWTSVVSGAYPSMLVYNVAGSANPLGLNHPTIQQGMRFVGYTKKLMDERFVDLVGMEPRDDLLNPLGLVWCLAREGEEYIIYFFDGGSTEVFSLPATYDATWLDPRTGVFTPATADGNRFTAPAGGDQVLHIAATNSQRVVVPAVADAYVAEDAGSSNFGSTSDLQIRHHPVDQGRLAFLEFDVPAFSGTVASAEIRLRTQSSPAPGVSVFRVTQMSWNEHQINFLNWDQAGTVSFSFLSASGALAANTWHGIDVSNGFAGSGVKTFGMASAVDQDSRFWSRESAFPPQLRILRTNPGLPPILVNASKDAWVAEDSPATNFGGTTDLRVRQDPVHSGRHAFLRFVVPGYPGSLVSARLRIRTMGTSIPSASLFRVNDMGSWNEATINWLNWDQAGAVSFDFLTSKASMAPNTWHELDVTGAVGAPGTLLNLGIASSADQPDLRFWSRESGSFAPELVITSTAGGNLASRAGSPEE